VRSRTVSSSSRRHSHRSRRPWRLSQPTRSSPRPPPTPHATTPRQPTSPSFTTDHIRRRRPISCRSCGAVQAANPDIVYVAAYPPDTVGIVRAANEINLVSKMFGGAMIGMLVTPIKVQLGPLPTASSSAKVSYALRPSSSPASPICSSATKPKRPARASIRSAMDSCRSAMLPVRCSPRRWKKPRAPMMTSSLPTSTATRSRPWSAISPSARMANGEIAPALHAVSERRAQ
jgi:hypothetical protein